MPFGAISLPKEVLMATHSIHTVEDAWRVLHRYGLENWLHLDSLESFACWLYQRTRQVSTEDVARYLREYIAAREGANAEAFDAANRRNAEDAMHGYRCYEKSVSDLMWLVRMLRTRQSGRRAWSAVAELAVVRDRAAVIHTLPSDVLPEVQRLLIALGELRLSFGPIRYVAGADEVTDAFMYADIERLDETLADDALWRDEEEHIWPTEISALAQLVEDQSVRPMIEAKLLGTLSVPADVEAGEDALH
jgi:hypothetical protein